MYTLADEDYRSVAVQRDCLLRVAQDRTTDYIARITLHRRPGWSKRESHQIKIQGWSQLTSHAGRGLDTTGSVTLSSLPERTL
jgi:hypothetical protein